MLLAHGQTPTSQQAQKLREYRWSSYRTYGGYEAGPDWLRSAEILRRGTVRKEDRHKDYRGRVGQILWPGAGRRKTPYP